MKNTASPSAGLTARLSSAVAKITRAIGRAPDSPKPDLRGLTPPGTFNVVRVIQASVPEGFRPFEESETAEILRLSELIADDTVDVERNTEDSVRRAYKRGDYLVADLPMSVRLEQAKDAMRKAKARLRRNCDELGEALLPGLRRIEAALKNAAEEYAAAEQAAALRLGVGWEPSCVVRAIVAAVDRVRMRHSGPGYLNSIAEATFGFIGDGTPFAGRYRGDDESPALYPAVVETRRTAAPGSGAVADDQDSGGRQVHGDLGEASETAEALASLEEARNFTV